MPLLHNKTFQRFMAGSFLERWGVRILAEWELFMLGFHKERKKLGLIRAIRRERRSLLLAQEQFLIHSIAQAMRHMEGDMAEVGVYAGSSTKMICEAKGDKRLHVCDTFAGLPAPTAEDGGVETQGCYACGLDSIRAYLAGFPNVEYHVGFCPDSVRGVLDDARFCFVHLDLDLYSSTKQCLEYFFPRLVPGGVILSHDYSLLDGVRQAFDEFVVGRREGVIELPTTQCMLVKAGGDGA
ncbi:MAG: TylF/MycF/NovP-related O-methyltransferase [Planctomycetaceae bacterium]